MFLLVSVRHVGAHAGEHQHGVSIQISVNLGKTFLRISRIRNIPLTWILERVFVYVPPFISQILDFIYWKGFDFYFDLFWMAWQWKLAIFIWLYKRPMLTDFNHNNGASSRWKALRNKFIWQLFKPLWRVRQHWRYHGNRGFKAVFFKICTFS